MVLNLAKQKLGLLSYHQLNQNDAGEESLEKDIYQIERNSAWFKRFHLMLFVICVILASLMGFLLGALFVSRDRNLELVPDLAARGIYVSLLLSLPG